MSSANCQLYLFFHLLTEEFEEEEVFLEAFLLEEAGQWAQVNICLTDGRNNICTDFLRTSSKDLKENKADE